MPPSLIHVANLWTLMGHPQSSVEWSLETKLQAIKDAGFNAVCWAPSPELTAGARRHGLTFIGGMASGDKSDFPSILDALAEAGAVHVNVQLAAHDTPTDEALDLTMTLMQLAEARGLKPAIESHRGTCTETPEKTYTLANAYQRTTGKLLPISWDFSHFSVIKHLEPSHFIPRLLIRRDLVQHARQFHFRPFNGHHAQVPITRTDGEFTPEVLDWIPFAEEVLRCWLAANGNTSRQLLVCPELGPAEGGYALSTFPNSWDDAKILRGLIDRMWRTVCTEQEI